MSYLEHFGLTSEPFSIAPAGRFYFPAEQHQRVLARIDHAVSGRKGLCVVIGEIGAGKTSLARHIIDGLDDEHYEAAMMVMIHSEITAAWLLRRIALSVGVERPSSDRLKLLGQLFGRLVQIDDEGRKAVVLIDEAQMLKSRALMEEFRGLLNLEVEDHKLLTFVFFGLPELEQNLLLDPPLRQRVAVNTRLDPLDIDSTESYIRYRLKMAGAGDQVFPRPALDEVFRYSKGTPRLVNTICDNALLEAALDGEHQVRPETVATVGRALGLAIE